MGMSPEWKDIWIAALRSDQYTKTSCTLRDDDGFCCLGVLCDIAGGAWNNNAFDEPTISREGEIIGEVGDLTERGLKLFGLDIDEMVKLQGMNDGQGGYIPHSFSEIANYIEANL